MSEITKPIALDESLHTTEQTPRNLADVLADELQNLATAISGGSDKAPKTDIATVESGSTASRAYSVGELVYVNGNLYKVITAITSGATFTVGTNIQSTNVSGIVKDALDSIACVTGTLASSAGTPVGISYPTGFDGSNCVVIGAMYEYAANTYAMNANNGTQRFDVILYPTVISIIPRDASAFSKNVKIALKKFA